MKTISSGIFISLFIILFSIFYSCRPEPSKISEGPQEASIAEFKTNLPFGEGVNIVESNCGICHSTQYIKMQPHLSREAWQKIVDKMIHSYGLPIADSSVRDAIVEYLVDIRGKN